MTFESIVEAWLECESNKRSTDSCQKFRWHAARDLVELWQQMDSGRYKPRASMTFIVTYPVLREVWAGAFRDRVAHHWEAMRFGSVLEAAIKRMGNNSMNCREGYGSARAVATFANMISDATDGYTRDDCYIVGGDFANYFMSIDKSLLWSLLEREITAHYDGEDKAELLYMMHTTLMHRCQDHYFRRSPESMWQRLPKRKSLFHMSGLPIGNLTSQLWANYLGAHFMDWMMHTKGYQEFLLFVDDWRVLVRTAEEGRTLLKAAGAWLSDTLHIELHPDKTYLQHYTKGTRFVGTIIKPGRVYVSNRTRGKFISRMRQYNTRAAGTDERGRIDMLEKLQSTVNSYLGLMGHYRSYKIRKRICEEMILPVWGRYVYFTDGYKKMSIRNAYDKTRTLRHRLKSHNFAARFIRPMY